MDDGENCDRWVEGSSFGYMVRLKSCLLVKRETTYIMNTPFFCIYPWNFVTDGNMRDVGNIYFCVLGSG